MTHGVADIVAEMGDVAAPGQRDLDPATREELTRLTTRLVAADPNAIDEYEGYLDVQRRELDVSGVRPDLLRTYRDRRIVVTGGAGCIGSALIRQLLHFGPAQIFCLDEVGGDVDPIPGVDYLEVDLQHELGTRQALRTLRPDVVFHCAAQRSPWLAEREVARTVRTNVIGTRNVLRGARDVDVPNLVHASTGKAMRYHTSDVYAASKKLGEWLVHAYAEEGRRAGAARFTHVVDNAVLLQQLRAAESDPSGVMRVHGADIHLYVQSAIESAQLLLLAGLGTAEHGGLDGLQLLAIRDLGDPPDLLRLVIGRMQSRADAHQPAIYLSGPDKGYELSNTPGLYDPTTATEVSPLINAAEAGTVRPMPGVPDVDAFRLGLPSDRTVEPLVDDLAARCDAGNPSDIAAGLAEAVAEQAEAMFDVCPGDLFARLQRMANNAGTSLPTSREPGERRTELRARQVA